MDRDGSPLQSETGDIVWKGYPPTNNRHVLDDIIMIKSKDCVTKEY